MRSQLGLQQTDRPIVLAGHQGQLWHAGIAAKMYAAEALAERVGGVAVWLVVDTDGTDPYEVMLPTRNEEGGLEQRTVRLAETEVGHARPGMARPRLPKPVDALGVAMPDDAMQARLASMLKKLDAWSPRDCAGSQATLAALSLLPGEDEAGLRPPRMIVRASHLASTDAFAELVEAFRRDPDRMAAAYNAAVGSQPGSGVRRLEAGEIPFWCAERDAWRPATVQDLDGPLMPRALVLTGLMRAFACDLFIHGTGGAAYEPVNDGWLPEAVRATLAPSVTASATLRLRFGDGDVPTAGEVARAKWRAHRARHHPGHLGDDRAQSARDALVDQIGAAPRGSAVRASLYADLHGLLDTSRRTHSGVLAAIERDAAEVARRAAEHSVREDRTYPAALHDPEDLRRLRDRIRSTILGGPA